MVEKAVAKTPEKVKPDQVIAPGEPSDVPCRLCSALPSQNPELEVWAYCWKCGLNTLINPARSLNAGA
jgi:hypothetical protein